MTISEAFLRSHGDDLENEALVSARRMPVQKPGRSKQDYGTPWELIRAVETRWGRLRVDLAANVDGSNKKAFDWLFDSLDAQYNWKYALEGGLGWLNPPFANIAPWAEKCKLEASRGARIVFLVPASIGSEWFAAHVEGHARVIALRPRLTFEGCTQPYPKDCMLCLYGPGFGGPGFETWRWK